VTVDVDGLDFESIWRLVDGPEWTRGRRIELPAQSAAVVIPDDARSS
jgi:hypothetical protein